ncbi:tocopherol cyclase family protein [Prolixibacter bellariivorans]|nr:tocopherol cyclase family protein [Prolixibacter bellariivorans]
MGPYAFVPFMECYHGIVSMDHSIGGNLLLDGEDIDFTGGRGYTEKDWGRSFPSAYVWMQSNHFSRPGVSLKVSVAKIPWIRKAFVGFIAGLWLDGRLIRFTTYNKSILRKSSVSAEMVELIIENPSYRLVIRAYREKATELASPIHGFMEGRIEESMTSTIDVELLDRKRKMIIFKDTGRNAGLEVAGNIQEIIL